MVKEVKATPEDFEAFETTCKVVANDAQRLITKVIVDCERVQETWAGDFAKIWKKKWPEMKAEINKFPEEIEVFAVQMNKFAGIYRRADDDAGGAIKAVPGVGGE